jgi:hypothetical protein
MEILALLVLVGVFFGFAFPAFNQSLRRINTSRQRGLLLAGLLAVPFAFAAFPTIVDDPGGYAWGVLRLVGYVLLPASLLLWRPKSSDPFDGRTVLAVLTLWLPVELDWLPDFSVRLGDVSLPLALLTAIDLGFLLFLILRPLDRLGYTFRFAWRDQTSVLAALLAFCLVGLPFGMSVGFIRLSLVDFEPTTWLVRFLAIYFLNALPEELLFRGVIQNLIERRFGRNWWTLLGAAVIFGLAHINNATDFHTPPNWPYAIMASLAGLAYGWTWRRSGKITASALTHTLVNFIWWVFF